MTITSLGRLSLGELNLGMSLALPGLKLRLEEAEAMVLTLQASIEISLGLQFDLEATLAGFEAALNVEFELPEIGAPIAGLMADLELLAVKLGKITATISDFNAALSLGGSSLSAWAYDGAANGFGPGLTGDIAAHHATEKNAVVDALILGSNDPVAWGALSAVMYTGGPPPSPPPGGSGVSGSGIRSLGNIPGPVLLTGLALTLPGLALDLSAITQLITDLLGALKLSFELLLQIPISPGFLAFQIALTLPSVSLTGALMLTGGLSIGLEIGLDLALYISIVATLKPLVAQLELMLNGGGIQAWAYQGPLGGLGSALSGALSSHGDGKINGFVLTCPDPAAWATLSKVLKVN